MGRAPCCEKGLRKGSWTPDEDRILVAHIQSKGHKNWRALPKQAGLLRCGKSCRLRWLNYLMPGIKRGNFTKKEEDTIIDLHKKLGNRWSSIAATLPGRTDNEIKNVWHTYLKKRIVVQDENAAQAMQVPIVGDAVGESPGLRNTNDSLLSSLEESECSEISSSSNKISSVAVTGTSNIVPIAKVEPMNACASIKYDNVWTDALSHDDINNSLLDCDIASKPALSLSNTFSSHCSSSTIKDDEINGWLSLHMELGNFMQGQAIQ